ncbi:unnamed protein product [Rhodiola kirilowii]
MVYSSAPLYLDPHNWHHHQQQAQLHQQQQQLHQQQNQQLSVTTHGGGGGGGGENPLHQQIAVQMQPPAPSQAVGGGSSSSIRPGSMADRARQAKIPQPEPGLKCPRCDSTNTKFCYFNNYSLTQPRHFCKMCRRYWTRGGALRNVPVGGGCRRNKRSSSKSGGASKSAGGERQITGTGLNDNSTSPISSNSNNTEINNNNNSHVNMLDTSLPGQSYVGTRMTQFPLLASLQGLTHGQYGSPSSNLGLNFNGMMHTSAQGELGFPIGASSGNSDQWRPHHYPNFLAGFDPPQVPHPPPPSSSLYQFPHDHHQNTNQLASNPPQSRSSISISAMNQQAPSTDQIKNNEAAAAVKPEGAASQGGGMNFLSRSFLGMSENSQYWVGNNNNNTNNNSTWTDLSGLNSSTTSLL